MRLPSRNRRRYLRRDRERSTLHEVVRTHLETFLAQTRAGDPDGAGVPAFVEAELRRFLEFLAVFLRAVFGQLRARAAERGHPGGRAGSVTVIQRFGGALNLNPHFHTLVPDGVFIESRDGTLRFHRLPPPTDAEIATLTSILVRRVRRLLIRRGVWREGDDGIDYVEPSVRERLGAASIQQVALTGAQRLRPTARIRTALPSRTPQVLGRRRARLGGFDLHANTAIRGKNRSRLERLCRYLLRPPVSESRIERSGDHVLLELKTPWNDGTTHLSFEPTELLERLAALVPRPQKNLLLYHGVLAANAKLRGRVVAYGRPSQPKSKPPRTRSATKRHNPTWSELMRRGLDIDSLDCPKCHGRMRFIASIIRRVVIRSILTRLALPADPIVTAPARAPPTDDLIFDVA